MPAFAKIGLQRYRQPSKRGIEPLPALDWQPPEWRVELLEPRRAEAETRVALRRLWQTGPGARKERNRGTVVDERTHDPAGNPALHHRNAE
jgi:hypothetical protein